MNFLYNYMYQNIRIHLHNKCSRQYCLDAQICSLSWVSFGLEPASDGSGRRTHLLRRDGPRTTTTPSTSTVTSGTERAADVIRAGVT